MTDDFLTRLKIERDELLDRHNKLQAFLREGVFRLPLNQQFMLKLQAGAMHQYLTILNARLDDLRTREPALPSDEPIVIEQNTFDIDRDGLPE